MFNFKGIDHINMRVKSLEKSFEFYKKVFGFEIKEKGFSQISQRDYWIIGLSNKGALCLYEDPNLELKSGHVGHFGINIDFQESMLQKLKELGVKVNFYNPSGISSYPNSQSIYIEDPDGNELELSSVFAGGL